MIYFIQYGDNGPIKIGTANDIHKRVKSLQSLCPYKLKILKTIPGDNRLEYKLHNRFDKYRMRGEWFEPNNEILSYIIGSNFSDIDNSPDKTQNLLEKLILTILESKPSFPIILDILLSVKDQSISQIANQAGVSRQMVHSVITGKRNSKKVKQAISKALGFNPWE